MKAKVIKTARDYEAALARVEKLMDAKRNTPQGDELDSLSLAVHNYEEKALPIDKPNPFKVIRFGQAGGA
jgi:HTH-type transcriptional regulator/antitoxin HigA